VSWDQRFSEPIVLRDGAKLASLREAIAHLVKREPAGLTSPRLDAPTCKGRDLCASAFWANLSTSPTGSGCRMFQAQPIGRFAYRRGLRFDRQHGL
jgi:hypothetical protein